MPSPIKNTLIKDTVKNLIKKLEDGKDEKGKGHFTMPIVLATGKGKFPIRN